MPQLLPCFCLMHSANNVCSRKPTVMSARLHLTHLCEHQTGGLAAKHVNDTPSKCCQGLRRNATHLARLLLCAGDLFDFDLEVEPILEVLVGKTLEQAALDRLNRYNWPGNIREL